MEPRDFFDYPQSTAQKQYEALRMYFVENINAREVARRFGYTYRGFTTIVSEFRKQLKKHPDDLFFQERKRGRKITHQVSDYKKVIIDLRKQFYSVEDIKVSLDSKGYKVSEKTIYNILKQEGFSRLPRRSRESKQQLIPSTLKADKSVVLSFNPEEFKSSAAGILCLLPYIKHYQIDRLIEQSGYPETNGLPRLNSILSFVALKGCNVRRYSADNLWCMDRGLGVFAGLNVLPKAAWFSSYSDRVTSEMNHHFLKAMHQLWLQHDLLEDTMNLDFTAIPYWGEDEHLENNWSGKRGKALSSMLAVLAHDPDSGIIDYGNTNITHAGESSVVLEFLDFYRGAPGKNNLKYLVFDSKFTNYQNLSKLDDEGVKFITIRRRGKNLVKQIENIPPENWKNIRVEAAGNKKRTLKVSEDIIYLKGYDKKIRQIIITGHGKIKPAIIITNDFELKTQEVVRKYTKRWIVEKSISEQIDFFHLNNVSSSMVIKVDFDLTMSILTHNLYRLLAKDLERYAHHSDQSIYEKFLLNGADIKVQQEQIHIALKKKRNLPLILEKINYYNDLNYHWLNNKKLNFVGNSYS